MDWKYTSDNPLKVITLFSGYDSQCMALRNLGIPYDLIGWSEIDKYAIAAHNAVFPQFSDRNLGDVTKIDWNSIAPEIDLMTYSSPCQDISNAGKQAGFDEGSGTRSSLLWEVKRAILAKKPKYLLFENVKAVISKKFKPGLVKWIEFLDSLGYANFIDVLNSKDFSCPQNRERVFMVSILGEAWFSFPQPRPLDVKLVDVLEDSVDEKYYLDQSKVEKFIAQLSPEKLKKLEDA